MTQTDPWHDLENEIITCRKCPRLVAWREEVAGTKRRAYLDWDYWGKPVPGFGDPDARILVVGLAPGAHGSNRTGRMFTGDGSGEFLYPALHRAGFANQPVATHREDGLALKNLFITAVARCAPPQNKPSTQEIENCQPYLLREIAMLTRMEGIVALGAIAFQRVLALYRDQFDTLPVFAHGALYKSKNNGPWLLASYHPSRQNTQTGRLTPTMFDEIWSTVRHRLETGTKPSGNREHQD